MAKEKAKKPLKAAKERVVKEPKKKAPVIKEKAVQKEPEARVEAVEKAPVAAAPAEHVIAPHVAHKPAPKPKPKYEVFYAATGRRKTSIARVKLIPGSGKIAINNRPLMQYLAGRETLEVQVMSPLKVTDSISKYDVVCKVRGGGVSSQAGAIAHGIARALIEASPELRAKLKPEGLLMRDPRMKERKKYGQKKARKRFQYSKR